MFNNWSDYEKRHDYLVCVDSDGCAMDTMDCKHIHCFGPCMVTEWGLQEWGKPFPGARDGLAAAAEFADVAIVSSANRGAVLDEWTAHKLLDHADIVLAQDCGSKAHCIAEMLKFGYAPDHVLMVGDAPGDRDAAAQNGVYCYPILVRREGESCEELRAHALAHLQSGAYAPYEAERIAEFLKNLGG